MINFKLHNSGDGKIVKLRLTGRLSFRPFSDAGDVKDFVALFAVPGGVGLADLLQADKAVCLA